MLDRMVVNLAKNAARKIEDHFKPPPTKIELLENEIDAIVERFKLNAQLLANGLATDHAEDEETLAGISWNAQANPNLAIDILIPCAKAGDSFALNKLGEILYARFQEFKKDDENYKVKAVAYLKKLQNCFKLALNCGNRFAVKNSGRCSQDLYYLNKQTIDLFSALRQYRLFLLYDQHHESVQKNVDLLADKLLEFSLGIYLKSDTDPKSTIVGSCYHLSMIRKDVKLLGSAFLYNQALINKLYEFDIKKIVNEEPNTNFNERTQAQALEVMLMYLQKESPKVISAKMTKEMLENKLDVVNLLIEKEDVIKLDPNNNNSQRNSTSSTDNNHSAEEKKLHHRRKKRHAHKKNKFSLVENSMFAATKSSSSSLGEMNHDKALPTLTYKGKSKNNH